MGLLDILAMSSDLGYGLEAGFGKKQKSTPKNIPASSTKYTDLLQSVDDKLASMGYNSPTTGSPVDSRTDSTGGSLFPDLIEESEGDNKKKKENDKSLHYNVNYDPEKQQWKNFDPGSAEKWLGSSMEPSEIDPFSMSYADAYELKNPVYYDTAFPETINPERVYMPLSQGDEYRDYIKTEEGQRFLDTYGYDTYEKLRASQDPDAFATLLGLRDGMEGIKSWRPRYSYSGVDFSDPEKAEENLTNWLKDNIVDVGEFERGNRDIKLANDLWDSGAAARYLHGEGWRWASDVGEKFGLDEDDVALLAMVLQAENEGLDDAKQVKLAKAWEEAAGGMGGKKIKSAPIRSKEYDSRKDLSDEVVPFVLSSDLDMIDLPEGEYKSQADARRAYDERMAKTILNISGNDGNRRIFVG